MDLGLVGLGKMGGNMALRLLRGGHRVAVHDHSKENMQRLAREGAKPVESLVEMVRALPGPRAVWLMIPAGDPVDKAIDALTPLLSPGDTIIDGGNTYYKDTLRRAAALTSKGLHLVDSGTSGGIWGLDHGYSLMIGGDPDPVGRLTPIFQTLAPTPDSGWGHVGPCGAGHFVKMVHNGIEYGMMQAFAEGFAIMEKKAQMRLNLHQVGRIWQHGSVVRSWLLDLAVRALEQDRTLDDIRPVVGDSGEGRWTVAEAIELNVAAPVITDSLLMRIRSRDERCFAERVLAVLRNQFGGHAVQKGGSAR
ncbi:MAG: decarboxylating 6-phosphogluconate dehydrogenase [Phycisphaerae bacterium]|nr:decarboxylating 6-phosphogluconate dehydrogenase [Phycisphaerae bacterium]